MDMREGLKASGCSSTGGSELGNAEYGIEFFSSSVAVPVVVVELLDFKDETVDLDGPALFKPSEVAKALIDEVTVEADGVLDVILDSLEVKHYILWSLFQIHQLCL